MRPLTDICWHMAVFLDDTGRYVGKKKISFDTKTFNFINFAYVFDSTKFVLRGGNFMNWIKYYFYHLGNPEPILFKQDYKPLLTAVEFGNIINSKKLQELNDLSKPSNPFLDLLKSPVFWIILIVGGGLIWYMSQHGWKLW